jgi:hypothetical protein
MLPGFRFLFAAIVLSMSILVFGLGAAGLLRAAHEEFASTPQWHAAPETNFAQQAETTGPVLAMLHVDAPVAEQKAPDEVPQTATPTEQPAILPAPADPEAKAVPVELEKTAVLQPDDSPPFETAKPEAAKPEIAQAETAKPEIPVAESPAQQEATPVQPIAAATAVETKMAISEAPLEEASSPARESAPAVREQARETEQASPPASIDPSSDAGIASTKIATLGGPPVAIEGPPPAKPDVAKHDRSLAKKRAEERRTKRHRRMVSRAPVTQQALQQPSDPFGQPVVAARRR